jgi:hypothetical protein
MNFAIQATAYMLIPATGIEPVRFLRSTSVLSLAASTEVFLFYDTFQKISGVTGEMRTGHRQVEDLHLSHISAGLFPGLATKYLISTTSLLS